MDGRWYKGRLVCFLYMVIMFYEFEVEEWIYTAPDRTNNHNYYHCRSSSGP